VVTALGTHRDMTDEEIAERIGDEMFKRIKCYNHHFENQDELASVGVTPKYNLPVKFNKYVVEADVVISIGCIEAHEQAGVGGGFKNIMPGVSDSAPIYKTHNAKFQRPPRISLAGMPREQCRFRQALEECGELLGPKVFIVNTVTAGSTVLGVCAGHPIKAHAAGREVYEKMAKIELPNGQADVVIAAARPLDIDLRVTMKSCFNAAPALKPGGIFISVSATTEKMGDLRLPDNLPKFAGAAIRKMPIFLNDFLAGKINPSPDQAAGTVSLIKMLKSFQAVYLMTTMTEHNGAYEAMGVHCYTDIQKLLESAAKLKPEGDVTVLNHAGASFISWD
jgi:lactate racemase